MANGGLQSFELVCRNAFIFKHHGYAVIDPVDSLVVLCDQSFGKRDGHSLIACIADCARRDLAVNLLQLVRTQCSERLLAYRAAQNLEQLSVYWHVVYLPVLSPFLTMGMSILRHLFERVLPGKRLLKAD